MFTAYERIVPEYPNLTAEKQEIVRLTVRGLERECGDLHLRGGRLDFETVKAAIGHSLQTGYGIGYEEVFNGRRNMEAVRLRQMIFHIVRKKFTNPTSYWASQFGYDHASLGYHIGIADDMLAISGNYQGQYNKICDGIENYLMSAGLCKKGKRGTVL